MNYTIESEEINKVSPSLIKKKLQFDELVGYLNVHFQLLPGSRRGFNTIYGIRDAALSAFSVFFTQCASFLAHQKKMQETNGKNNAASTLAA